MAVSDLTLIPGAPSSITRSVNSIMADKASHKRSRVSYGVSLDEAYLMKTEAEAAKAYLNLPPMIKSIVSAIGADKKTVERLSFEVNPESSNKYAHIYRPKSRLLPDELLKKIAIQDDLVAAIVLARANHMESFGRPRPDRFSTGFVIEPNTGIVDGLSQEEKKDLDRRIQDAVKRLATCGKSSGWDDHERLTFSQWLKMSCRNALIVGRIATEIIWVDDPDDPSKKIFHSFRPIDAGTIYFATPKNEIADTVRKDALLLLAKLRGEEADKQKLKEAEDQEYAWVQVIQGMPRQVFTSRECIVHNFYPVTDIELEGYPVTPIDTMISAVVTHINITTHNKLYFQSGRAARGMLVIKSDDVDEHLVSRIKQQFNASINSVSNAHRMPVFAVGVDADVTWQPIDNSSRDMEFQYLTDMNARIIMTAFMMSPEELPGWSYLSRGTNSQALSESNNEYKLQAARDLGIRPLIAQFEDYINARILPLIDPYIAERCRVKLVGLEAETAEKESVRTQQDMPVHMTMDQVLQKVEKKPYGKALGGEFPFNPQFQAILDKYLPVGVILERFFGMEGASQDPSLQYYRDPFWFQNQSLQLQKVQMQQQAQMAQQQAAMAQQQQAAGGGGDPGASQPEASGVSDDQSPNGGKGATAYPAQTEHQKTDQVQGSSANGQGASDAQQQQAATDLTRSIDQAIEGLTKNESALPPSKRRLLAQHRKTVDNWFRGWKDDLREAQTEILGIVEGVIPKKR